MELRKISQLNWFKLAALVRKTTDIIQQTILHTIQKPAHLSLANYLNDLCIVITITKQNKWPQRLSAKLIIDKRNGSQFNGFICIGRKFVCMLFWLTFNYHSMVYHCLHFNGINKKIRDYCIKKLAHYRLFCVSSFRSFVFFFFGLFSA